MTERPTDDELRTMLQELPRPAPPPGFAEGVMARVRAEHRRRRFRPWLLAAAAALAVSGLLLRSDREAVVETATAPVPETPPADPDRREFEAIVEEYRLLAEEIEAMRRFAGEPPFGPLVRIGGSEETDLYLDLESWLDLPPRRAGAVVPASDRGPR